MDTPHGKIIEENDYSMLHDMEFILLSDSIFIKDSLFCTFSVIVAIWDNFLGSTTNLHKALTMQNRIITVMLGYRQRTSCRQKFKKLQILTVPRIYILEMMMFVIKNPDKYQTTVSIHSKDMRQKNQLHLQSVTLSSVQKGA